MDRAGLEIFVEVARNTSFAAVARRRRLTASSVSRSVASLEAELGVRLINRHSRKLVLTEAGAVFRDRVNRILEDLSDAQRQVQSTQRALRGRVRVLLGSTLAPLVAPVLAELRARHPDLKLDVGVDGEVSPDFHDRGDAAVTLQRPSSSDLVAVRLCEVRYVVCAAPRYLELHGAPVAPVELTARECVLVSSREGRPMWRFQDPSGAVRDVNVDGACTASDPAVALQLALSAVGIALVPEWLAAPAVGAGQMVELFPECRVTPGTGAAAAWILYPGGGRVPERVKLLVDFVKERFAAHGAKPAEPRAVP